MRALLEGEWYRLRHDRSFLVLLAVVIAANAVVLSGGHQLEAAGRDVLSKIMVKQVPTIMIASVYGGLYLGSDFESRTMGLPLQAGAPRGRVLLVKAVVFIAAMESLVLFFPLLAVAWCTLSNGWGASFSLDEILSFFAVAASLILLVAAISSLSILSATLFRSAVPTIGVPIALALVQIPVLNALGTGSLPQLLPLGSMVCVAGRTMPVSYGAAVGIAWCAALMLASYLVLRRANLR